MGHFTVFYVLSAGLIVMGALMLPSYTVTGVLLMAAGIAFVTAPNISDKSPKVYFDGKVLKVQGALTDLRIDLDDMRGVTHRGSVEPEKVNVGHSDRRFFGGNFTDQELGDIWMAVDRRIPMCIVLDCTGMRCVFNHTDLPHTKELYDRLYSAIREK